MRRSIRQDDGSVALDEQVCEGGWAQVAEAEQYHEATRSAHKNTACDSQCKRDCDEPGEGGAGGGGGRGWGRGGGGWGGG